MKTPIAILLLAGCAAPPAPAPIPDDHAAWRAEKDARIASLEAALAAEKGFSQKVREQIALADRENAALTARLAPFEEENKKQTDLVRKLMDRINALDVENSSKAIRLNDLFRQLDFSNTLLTKLEGSLQALVKQSEDRSKETEKLRARVAELEKKEK